MKKLKKLMFQVFQMLKRSKVKATRNITTKVVSLRIPFMLSQ